MGSGLTARDVSVTARVGDFHSGDGEGDRAAAAASEAASGATVAMPLEAWAASLPGTCKVFVFRFVPAEKEEYERFVVGKGRLGEEKRELQRALS